MSRMESARLSWPPTGAEDSKRALARARRDHTRNEERIRVLGERNIEAHKEILEAKRRHAEDKENTTALIYMCKREMESITDTNKRLAARLAEQSERSDVLSAMAMIDEGRASSADPRALERLIAYGIKSQREMSRARTCVVCLVNPIEVICSPCGHATMCAGCSAKCSHGTRYGRCPVCKASGTYVTIRTC